MSETKELIVQQPASLTMLNVAIEKGMEPEKLLQFYEIHDKWEKNEARKAFVSAMSDFRSRCPVIARTKQGHNSKYAGLAESIDQVKSLMSECGLSHSWRTRQKENEVFVTCVLTHVAGHSEETTLSAPKDDSGKKSPIQAIASTISYLERYTFYAITGMTSAEMDNDGYQPPQLISAEQIKKLEEQITKAKADKAKFLELFGIKSLSELPVNEWNKAVVVLKAKK